MEPCESLRKRVVAVMSEDKISELPEHLILKILSLLPTKLVISTSVLSKQWQSVWTMVPILKFESYGNKPKFSENVTKSLLSNKASVLEKLHMEVSDKCEDVYIGIWVGIAVTRHVRELVLDLYKLYGGKPVRFPSSLFCYDTLETLKLKGCVFLDVPCLVSMKSLRTLHLHRVVYKDDASVHNFLSSCSNLEHLVVHRCFINDVVVSFVINVPSLKTLSLYGPNSGRENGGFVINAPCLKYLNIESLTGYKYLLFENASEVIVEEANIRNVSHIGNEMIIGSLKSAKRLSLDLSPLQITHPTRMIFYQLVYLEMYTHKVEWWNLLTLMLDSSPKLQVLKLIDDSSTQKNLVSDKKNMQPGKWNEPKDVPECLLLHLETFVWTRHDWIREEEKEVARYILSNARQLKKATFSLDPIESKRLFKLEKRKQMLEELPGVVRASKSCHFAFEFE